MWLQAWWFAAMTSCPSLQQQHASLTCAADLWVGKLRQPFEQHCLPHLSPAQLLTLRLTSRPVRFPCRKQIMSAMQFCMYHTCSSTGVRRDRHCQNYFLLRGQNLWQPGVRHSTRLTSFESSGLPSCGASAPGHIYI